MADIQILWDNTQGEGDWQLVPADIATTSGLDDLENAVLLSLMTDRRASDPNFVPWDGNPRGWWFDSFSPTPLGSQLWRLDRAKKTGTQPLLLAARDYATAALQWLLDDGIASTVDVKTRWATRAASPTLVIDVTITKPRQAPGHAFRYSVVWA